MKKNTILATTALFGLLTTSAGAEEATWRKDIQPLVELRCAACHGAEAAPEYYAFKEEKEQWLAKAQGMRMDTYSHLLFYTAWPDTGALMRRLDDGTATKDGKPGNMYQHLGSSEQERQKNLATFNRLLKNSANELGKKAFSCYHLAHI